MFTIKAGYSSDIELKTSIDKARDFFRDITNYADMMPGIVQVYTDANGVAHWKVETQIPVVGKIFEKFSIQLSENNAERIEWAPLPAESHNFLRYSADFLERAKDVTLVHFSQAVELRRKSARDLHYLAGLAGETLISSELTRQVTEMIKTFIAKAKVRLER